VRVALTPQLPWYVARASGLVAWALAWASVMWGLALSTRALGSRPKAPWLNDLHRTLGGLTAAFVVAHLVALLFDTYVPFGPRELFVPFATHWKPGAVAWGIVAFYLLVAIETTSLLMKRLPRRVWRGIHLFSYAFAVMATLHLLTAGTDRHIEVLRLVAVGLAGATFFFVLYRVIGPGRAASVRSSRPRSDRTAGGTSPPGPSRSETRTRV
jgi:DMSO/TMAO reductase YedYZ heme-binding membrane subunit